MKGRYDALPGADLSQVLQKAVAEEP